MFPYGWTPHTIGKNLRYGGLSVYYGIKNIVRWTPIIWDDADFDWEYLARIMEYKMRRMAKCHAQWVGVDGSRMARQLTICAVLLKRIREDDYPSLDLRQHGKAWADHWAYMAHQDVRLLGEMIGKYLTHWWD